MDTEERHELVQRVDDYSNHELARQARHYDVSEAFPDKEMKQLFDMDILEELYSENSALTYRDYLSIIRLICKNFPALGSILLTQESHCVWPILTLGSPSQQHKYAQDILTGQTYGCFALNEPVTGSELEELTTLALETPTGWEISGKKDYISNAPVADVLLIASKVQCLDGRSDYGVFVIDKQTPGVKVGQIEQKMGIKALPVAGIVLEKVQLRRDQLLGEKIDGEQQIRSILNRNRLSVAAQSLGIAGGALDRGLNYVSYDRNLGKRLIDMQSIQFKLADIETEIYAARALLMQVLKNDVQDDRFVAMTKLTASNLAIEASETIINLTGGYGYMRNNDIERFVRDAKITAIYGSSSNRLRRMIAQPWIDNESKRKR